jgi:tetratricopeptide (TPR) repeat protein
LEAARAAEEQAGAAYSSGRYEEAWRAQQRSVAIHRQLVGQDPSQRQKLAASLHNLGVVLIRLGRKDEAVAPTEEALALYRAMAVANGRETSSAMERPLRNLMLLYFEGNRPQEALLLADELVRLHQILSPQDPALQAEQVDVLNLRASLLVALNRPQAALGDLDAAVAALFDGLGEIHRAGAQPREVRRPGGHEFPAEFGFFAGSAGSGGRRVLAGAGCGRGRSGSGRGGDELASLHASSASGRFRGWGISIP